MQIHTLETPSLGDRSYVVATGDRAVVIDPQRDIARVLELVAAEGLTITHVLETHVHNDYVSGGLELARATGAEYHVPAGEAPSYACTLTADGDVIALGTSHLRAVHTPGHTPTHLAFVANDGDRDVAVFSGGSMLFGSVGRTDLISPEATDELSRAQYRSVRLLAGQLPGETEVRPTHGFGSFCSSGDTSGASESTIADERLVNDALLTHDEDLFVQQLLDGLDAYPAYYAHMAPTNLAGPAPIDLSPVAPLDAPTLRAHLDAGDWVIDLRSRVAFAQDHVDGTVNIELDDQAPTYLGWLVPWDAALVLVGDGQQQIDEMQLHLTRIGFDRLAGQVADVDSVDLPRRHHARTGFRGLHAAIAATPGIHVLDVRRNLEWGGGHVPGAQHIPLHELASRMDEVPAGEVWVHCQSGYRAGIAASLLSRAGRDPVHVDADLDGPARALFGLGSA